MFDGVEWADSRPPGTDGEVVTIPTVGDAAAVQQCSDQNWSEALATNCTLSFILTVACP